MKYQHKPSDIHIVWKIGLSIAAIISIYLGLSSGDSTFTKIVYSIVGLIVAGVILRTTWRKME